jgi:hypothetical protein
MLEVVVCARMLNIVPRHHVPCHWDRCGFSLHSTPPGPNWFHATIGSHAAGIDTVPVIAAWSPHVLLVSPHVDLT